MERSSPVSGHESADAKKRSATRPDLGGALSRRRKLLRLVFEYWLTLTHLYKPVLARQPEMLRQLFQAHAFDVRGFRYRSAAENPGIDNAAAGNVIAAVRDRSFAICIRMGARKSPRVEFSAPVPRAGFQIFEVEAKKIVPSITSGSRSDNADHFLDIAGASISLL